MNNQCINIAISGLGLTTSDDLKIRLRKILPNNIGINWTSVSDQNIHCILINEQFFENDNIQNIIQNKKIPYLKISKHSEHTESAEDNLLCIPIYDESTLKNWVNIKLLQQTDQSSQTGEVPADEPENDLEIKEIDFFSDLYIQDSRKIILSDHLGTIAIIDHHAHLAWLEATRDEYQTDRSIHYTAALTADFIKVSRKRQFNLENWLFNLIWKNPELVTLPAADKYYRLKFWVQPNQLDKKLLLQLTACFIYGAEIQHVSDKLNIPVATVQHFIAANLAIRNAEIISAKDSQFDKTQSDEQQTENKGILKSFFNKLKSKFKF
ncbi:MAG: hypothetical protein GAK29_01787 [Acinetobacter bereziniae]|uniref:Uncharacterized protein n=1 Tax=Acinetobacter bereziniae TaxID=106648 RepID=A0A833URI7_ACIBZ|nr:MAG: hypothetical protein GAK29_01787 [Acinetobacter bereziniae]